MLQQSANCWFLPVKVVFEPPRLSVGGVIDLPIGPKSSVQLTTTYLSEDVRLGKGSRGSLFVFTRGGPSDDAGQPLQSLLYGRRHEGKASSPSANCI